MKRIRQVMLFAIVLLLLVGVASASDVESNDIATLETSTTTSTNIADANEATQKDINTPIEEIQEKDIINEKTITKKNENNVKTASKTYADTNTFAVFEEAITSTDYDVVTINITSDITLEKNLMLSSVIKNLSIYGNNHTIDGNGQYQFLKIDSTQTVNIYYITISNCFSENGGAIENNGTLSITNTTLKNNNATNYGGSIYNYGGNISITESTLQNNKARIDGGAIDNFEGNISIINSTIQNNKVTEYGGAISNYEGNISIINSTIQNNYADFGGAIYHYYGNIIIINSTIQNNTAYYEGGAIYELTNRYYNTTTTLYNSNFTDNTATNGAVIYDTDDYGSYNITYNTFKNNRATLYNETLIFRENLRGRTLEENTYINTDLKLATFNLELEDELTHYLLGEDVNLKLTINPVFPEFYDADISKRLYKTLYINDIESTIMQDYYTLSDLPIGNYSIYYTVNNYTSNTVTFKVNGDLEVNVTCYTELVQAIENATNERYGIYKINLLPGDYNATQNITWTGSETKKILINGNGNVLDGIGTYKFIDIAAGHELTLENITITNYRGDYGGAIYNNGTLTITDSILENNNATYTSGAVENSGTLTIKNSTLQNNKAGTLGGAIYNNGALNITDNSILQNNSGSVGGAIYTIGGSLYITDSTLKNNKATNEGGAVYNQGSLYIFNSTLENNKATSRGGAIYDHYANSLSIIDSTIQNNSAKEGGAIFDFIDRTTNIAVTLYNSNFTDNKADKGAVIYNYWGYGKYNITHNTFKNNTANIDNETLNFYQIRGEIVLEENTYINTDISMETVILTRGEEIPTYLLGEDVTLSFTVELEHPDYYDADILEKLNKTLYINSEEYYSTTQSDYILSDLEVGEYSIYFIAGNQESNTVTFKVNSDTQVNVTSYEELVEAIENATNERHISYHINLLPGDYDATQNITWADSVTRNIIINGNGNVLDGQNTYHFISIAPDHNLTLENIKITNYEGDYGGAIYNRGTLTITNTTIENNTGNLDGGAIYNLDGTVSITDSTIQNNKASIYAGAIRNTGTLTITNTTLQNNTADVGGAIHNDEATLTITESTIQNNIATSYGGAISNYFANTTITDSTIQNNTADLGGAIYDRTHRIYDTIITLYNSNFTDNTATNGATIYNNGDYGKYDITYNTFKNNTATNDKETLNLGANNRERTVTENTYINTDMNINTINIALKDDITTYTQDEDVTLLFTTQLEHPDYYETETPENIKINKTLYINDEQNDTTLMTNYTLSDLKLGENHAYYIINNQQSNTATFEVYYYSEISTPETSYEYYKGVDNSIPLIITDDSGQKGMITIAVKDEDTYTTISSYYNVANGYQLSTETLAKALENLYDTPDSSYTINITYSHDYLISSSTEFTLNIIKQRNTSIIYDLLNNTEGNVQINITVIDPIYNSPISDAQIELTGDITGSTTNGILTDNTLTPGNYTITATYTGNEDYTTSETTINFTVEIDKDKKIEDLEEQIEEILEQLNQKKATTITIDPISNVKYGDLIEISGLLLNDESLSISNQPVTITFNDEETTVTTRNGEFKYTTTANVLGENTITATYAGSDKYNESTATYTFEVTKADTTITIEDIMAVKKGESVTITGTLTDHNANPLANKVVRLLVNNGRKTLKTDADGVYTFDYALTRIGENTITATFEGDNYYTETTETITVEALALSTQITIDPVDTIVKGTKATFTGTLTDENSETIANAQVKLNINGNTKTLKTDSEGRFTHTFTMNTVGENTITATYAGSTNYEAAETEITVEVTKAQAVITLDPIDTITKGNNATFTGKLTDKNGKAIANAQVRITINGSPKTLRTDENGVFTHTFKMIKEGTNNITAIFNGNNDYLAAETSSTVEVIKAE